MPRRARVVIEGAVYHLYNRFARSVPIFAAADDAGKVPGPTILTIFHTARGGARPRWDQAINPSTAMARPQEIRSVGVTLSGSAGVPADWSTGEYAYDGAGNITAMGGETYTYDKV